MSTVVYSPAARPPRAPLLLVQLAIVLAWSSFGFAVTLGAFVIAPRAIGMQSFAILSGSMQPTLRVGDLVVDRSVRASDIRLGDIVTYRDPDVTTRLLTHRVVDYDVLPTRVDVVTRGDANSASERWSVPLDGRVGRVEFRVPKAGYVVMHGGGRTGRVLLLLVPVLLLGLLELKRIWFPKGPGRG